MEKDGVGDDSEDKKEEATLTPWSKLVVDFTQDTTLHGIRFVTGESKFMTRR